MKKSWCNKTSFSSIIESSEMSQMKARYDIYPTSFVWNFQKSHNFNDIVLFYITSLQISIKRFHEKAILKPLKIWIWISTISQKTVKSSNFNFSVKWKPQLRVKRNPDILLTITQFFKNFFNYVTELKIWHAKKLYKLFLLPQDFRDGTSILLLANSWRTLTSLTFAD